MMIYFNGYDFCYFTIQLLILDEMYKLIVEHLLNIFNFKNNLFILYMCIYEVNTLIAIILS